MSMLSKDSVENLRSPLAAVVDFHEEIGSTQERARELARGTPGASHGTLVVSRIQTGGRGRLGRLWGSPPGGVWVSLVLRPDMPARYAPRITQAAAVGVAKTLWDLGIEAYIKWPNDLLVRGREKICGIIAEADAGGAPVPSKRPAPDAGDYPISSVILGIGLNANLDPADLGIPDRDVTTVRAELGHDVDLPKLLGALLENLDTELTRIRDFAAVLDDWRALNCTLGRLVRVERFGKVLDGRAVDVTPEGALLLETSEGIVELFEGEIEHLRQEET